MRKGIRLHVIALFIFLIFYNFAIASIDLTIESIIDSSTLLKKITQVEDPLYQYFKDEIKPTKRTDIIEVINRLVLPNSNFAFEVTKMSELKVTERFENLSVEKQENIMIRNRELLSELYPDEIRSIKTTTLSEGFSINNNVKKLDVMIRLKSEIVNFLNEVIGNSNVLKNSNYLRRFFALNIKDEEIEQFICNLRLYNTLRIPINSIEIKNNGNRILNVIIKGKNNGLSNNILKIQFDSEKSWNIIDVEKIINGLKDAGYITNKEVLK